MATPIKNLIKNFIKEKQGEAKEKEKIRQVVDKVLDKKLKKHLALKRLYKNKLVFSSPASPYSYEFSLRKGELLKAIKKEFPYIKDIKIEIG